MAYINRHGAAPDKAILMVAAFPLQMVKPLPLNNPVAAQPQLGVPFTLATGEQL